MSRAARAAGLGSSSSRNKSSARTPEDDASLHAGFQNLGNTCFLNSVLQATAATRRLRQLYQPDFDDEDLEEDGDSTLDDTDIAQAQLDAIVASRSHGNHTPGPDASPSTAAARYAAAAAQIERSRSPALCLADQEHGRRGWAKHRQELILSRPSSTNGQRPAAPPNDAPAVVAPAPEPYVPTSADLPLNTAFRRVLEQSWARSSEAGPSSSSKRVRVAPVNPKPLLSQMASKYEQYGEYGQQDGHELLRHLLDSMRMEEMDLIKKLQPPEPKKKRQRRRGVPLDSKDDVRRPLDEGEEALREKYKLSPFVDTLFCGKLLSAVVCEGCRHVSHTYEDFFDISLPVRPELAKGGASGGKRNRIKSMADRWRRGVAQRPPERVRSAAENRPAFLTSDFSDAEPGSTTPSVAGGGIDRPRSAMPELSGGSGASTPGATGHGPSSADRDKMRFLLKRGSSRARERSRGKATDSEAEAGGMPDVGAMTLAPDVNAYADAEGILARRQEAVGGGLLRAVSRHSRSRKTSGEAAAQAQTDNSGAASGTEQAADSSAALPNHAGALNPAAAAGRKKSQAYIAQLFAEQPQEAAQPSIFPWNWRGPGAAQQSQAPAAPAGGVEAAAAAWVAAAAARRPHLHHLHGGVGGHHNGTHHHSSSHKEDAGRSEILQNQAGTGLIKSLEAFTAVEALDGDNSFACKRCWRRENPPTPAELAAHRRRRTKRGEDIDGSEHSSDDEDSEDNEGSSALSASLETATSLSSAAGDVDVPKAALEGEAKEEPSSGRSSTIPIIQTTNADTPTASAITIAGGSANGPGQTTLKAPKPIAPGSLKRLHAFAGGDTSSDEEESSTGEENALTRGAATDSGLSDAAESVSSSANASQSALGSAPVQPTPIQLLGAPDASGPRRKRSVQSVPRRALKRYLISSLPPVLVVHLKRFEMVGRGFGGFTSSSSKKIDDFVSFPEYLDVGPWLAPPREDWDHRGRLKESSDPRAIERERREKETEGGDGKLGTGEKEEHRHRWHWRPRSRSADRRGAKEEAVEVQRPRTSYRLYAVIVHQGNMSSGHYTAYVLSDRCGPSATHANGQGQGTPKPATAVADSSGTPVAGSPVVKTPSLPGGSGKGANGSASSTSSLERTAPASAPAPAVSEGGDAPLGTSLVSNGTSALSSVSAGDAVGGGGTSLKGTISNSSLGSEGTGTSLNPATSVSLSGSGASNGGTDSPRASVESVAKGGEGIASETATTTTTAPTTPALSSVPLSASTSTSPSKAAHASVAGAQTTASAAAAAAGDTRRWVFASDTAVRPASIDEVLKAKAYMLFYEQM